MILVFTRCVPGVPGLCSPAVCSVFQSPVFLLFLDCVHQVCVLCSSRRCSWTVFTRCVLFTRCVPSVPGLCSLDVCSVFQSPVFLLFLDCVHQLVVQHPDRFEFTDTYLVCLWDSVLVPVFDTFMFNSQRQRASALEGKVRHGVVPAGVGRSRDTGGKGEAWGGTGWSGTLSGHRRER